MQQQTKRKIPFNYTSADDRQVIVHIMGQEFYDTLSMIEPRKGTGRSSRLLHRFIGDMFVLERNPFLFQEMIDYPDLKKELFDIFRNDLKMIRENARHQQVPDIIDTCEQHLGRLEKKIKTTTARQKKIQHALGAIVGKDNIYFDAFNLTAHTTDATDWRLYPPVAVVRPSSAGQVSPLIRAVRDLGLKVIPRGAGTGLTGGAVPLTPSCVMINTEKLNRIHPVQTHVNGSDQPCAALRVEAGVITQDAMAAAAREGWVFATDPTSSWACTIGGNISENAGGKTAVLFGTAIDNLISYDMVMPDGREITVERRHHPKRKILPRDTVVFDIRDRNGHRIDTITLAGTDIRKPGLGKDVTNKTLNGLPGVQKEGCDGIITGAVFILYPEFSLKKTFCLEFFGDDMAEASRVITDLVDEFAGSDPTLIALEHFDEEYIKAINYKTKTVSSNRLKAVLLVDMVSSDTDRIAYGVEAVEEILDRYDNVGLSVAGDAKEAERFWQDRKRLGAIASHTNAFKLNEDIVLPIKALPDFARYVDQTNISEKRYTQKKIIDTIVAYLDHAVPADDPQWLEDKVSQARDLAFTVLEKLEIASRDAIEAWIHPRHFYQKVIENLRGYMVVSENVTRIYEQVKARLIVIATHMHAGDGNVHVNIPVMSNDREMMERAKQTADQVMATAVAFNGVVSGEHGIGVTKVKHLDEQFRRRFGQYRQQVDPDRVMNPEKLADPDIMSRMFTPSFNLLKLEASILKHSALEDLASDIASCVRCGRCKPQCPVFFPANNLFFHPRNKNLAVAALIEALLYKVQRTRTVRFRSLTSLEQIADHCTLCHKCFLKCPVKIDSARITIAEREILATRQFKHTSLPTQTALSYLSTRHPAANRIYRELLFKPASRLQPVMHRLGGRRLGVESLKSPVTRITGSDLYSVLPPVESNQALLLHPTDPAVKTVFYFPGCGSERLFSDISMAGIIALLRHQVRVVLPPPFLCCGYPFLVNARQDDYRRLMLQNAIIFSQIKEMFTDLEFDGCLVTCGTCMEALTDLGCRNIFGAGIEDIFSFLFRTDTSFSLPGAYIYHAPCHDSLNGTALDLFAARPGTGPVRFFPHCCSEAGTLSMSRPDISNAMLDRKADGLRQLTEEAHKPAVILTNCPSCIQGLGRLKTLGARPRHLMVEWVRSHSTWSIEKELKQCTGKYEIVNF